MSHEPPEFVGPAPPYAAIEASSQTSHTLYFTPLEEIYSLIRSDGNPVAVVAFIGHTAHTKSQLANLVLDQPAFIINDNNWSTNQQLMAGIEAHYDRQHATIYLNLCSLFEGPRFLSLCNQLDSAMNQTKSSNFDIHYWLQTNQSAELKLLLHCFFLSHLIFLVQPSHQLEVAWFELFRHLTTLKQILISKSATVSQKIQRILACPVPTLSIVCDATTFISPSSSLVKCSDISQTADIRIKPDKSAKQNPKHSKASNPIKSEQLAELQKSLESQTKSLSKKCNFDSLFQWANPAVHVAVVGSTPMDALLSQISSCWSSLDAIENPKTQSNPLLDDLYGTQSLRKWMSLKVRALHTLNAQHLEPEHIKHKRMAPKGFANGGLLPIPEEWFEYSQSLLDFFCEEKMTSLFTDSVSLMDPDVAFSVECCKFATEAARKTYFSGLPAIYGSSYHQKRVQLGLRVFNSLARGPALAHSKAQLLKELDEFWMSGHRKCDAVSVTNRPCIHDYHLTKDSIEYLPSKSIKQIPHSSGFKSIHRCNCGKNQSVRHDPFDLHQANTTFFSNPECCRYLPSLLETHLAKLRKESEKAQKSVDVEFEEFEDATLLAMPHDLRLVNLGWEVTVISNASIGLKNDGSKKLLANQTGFVEDYSYLMPWSVDAKIGSSQASNLCQSYIGIEYECQLGHRWFLTPQAIASLGFKSVVDEHGIVDVQALIETADLPIYTICTCAKMTAQLQRIYIVTPKDPSVRITFNLLVQVFGKAKTGAEQKQLHLDSGLSDHLVLPPDQLICIRLPYIYSLHEKPLLQGSLTSNSECRFFLEACSFGLIKT